MEESLKAQAGRADEPFQQPGESLGMINPASEADTLIDETAQCIRRYPSSAMAAAFGGGVLLGWLIARNLKARRYAGMEEKLRRESASKAYRRAISTWENEGGAHRA